MKNIEILAIIQARASSTRLPGKITKKILGKTLIELMVERVRRSQKIDMLILATSTDKSDDLVKSICDEIYLPCYRGSLENVLERFYQAALLYRPKIVIRLTGDCPLIDFEIIDNMIDLFNSNNYDYLSNAINPTFPDGLDCEIMTFETLIKNYKNAKLKSEIEHVTPFIYKNPNLFNIQNFTNYADLSNFRWTIDEQADFDFVKKIFEELYLTNQYFSMNDILKLLREKPELQNINSSITRNEGFCKSLNSDIQIKSKIKKSLEYQKRAIKAIPGSCQLLSKRPDMFTRGVWPGYFSKAEGAYVWDLDGNKYLDMSIGGIGANVLGYCDKDVNEAVMKAVNECNSTSLNCPEEVELAELLFDLHPWANKARFTKCGGESMAVAVRIARCFMGKDKVIFCGYHGWHDWYLAANIGTENALGEHLLTGLKPNGVPEVLKGSAFPFGFNNIEQLHESAKKAGNDLAAIILEPIRNDKPDTEFINAIRDIKNKTGAVLVVDEISSGFRMNCGGSHLLFGIEPDIAVFSKAIGNGYPIGAIIGKNDVMEAAQNSFISSTYWTERIGFTATIATINKFKKYSVHNHLMNLGRKVQTGWIKAAEKYSIKIKVGGIFPLSHFVFLYDNSMEVKAYFIQEMLKRGFLASTSCYIMFSHTKENVESYLMALEEVFPLINENIKNNTIKESLEGFSTQSGFKRLN